MRRGRALERIDARLGELLDEMRKQHELDREANRREHEQTRASNSLEHEQTRASNSLEHEQTRASNRREHEQTRGSFAQVNREILLELRDHREILLELRDHRTILESIDQGIQSNTRGLMHVLDELRSGRGGPGTAPAA